jgi:hypothetical protein
MDRNTSLQPQPDAFLKRLKKTIDDPFRERLRAVLELFSETYVASRANIAQGTISKILSGQKTFKLTTYNALDSAITALLLETPPSALQSASPTLRAIANNRELVSNVTLHEDYSTTRYFADFAQAQRLYITGLNLRRIVHSRLNDLDSVLNRGGSIQAILLDPASHACTYATIQDWGRDDDKSVRSYINSIEMAYETLCQVKADNKQNGERFEIAMIDYMLPFGIDAMEFDDPKDGALYVRLYPLKTKVDDRPILALRANDGEWYSFFRKQFDLFWNRAIVKECPNTQTHPSHH